jgi:hypothetical protein
MADQNLSFSIRLDSSGFQSGISSATRSLTAFRIALANALVSKGFSLLQRAAGQFASAFSSSLNLGSELTHLSAETGAAVSDLVVLRQAFQDCGVPAGTLSSALAMMNKSLSGVSETGQRTDRTFASLGLDIGKLRQMSPADAFEAIGRAIGSLGSSADRSAAAVALFGRSGSSLNRLFANPEAIKQARDAIGSMPSIMGSLSGSAESVQTAFGRIKTNIDGGIMGALTGILPVLDEIAEKVASIDFSKIGLKVGLYIKQLWEGGFSGLSEKLAVIGKAIWVTLREAVTWSFKPIFMADTWKALGLILSGVFIEAGGQLLKLASAFASLIGAGVLTAVDALRNELAKIPMFSGLAPAENKTFKQRYNEAMRQNSTLYQPGIDMGKDLMAEGISINARIRNENLLGFANAVMDSPEMQNLLDMFKTMNDNVESAFQGIQGESTTSGNTNSGSTFEKAAGKKASGTTSAASGPDADRWARIGAFAGNGAQAEALNLQRGSYSALKAIQTLAGRIHERMNLTSAAAL